MSFVKGLMSVLVLLYVAVVVLAGLAGALGIGEILGVLVISITAGVAVSVRSHRRQHRTNARVIQPR